MQFGWVCSISLVMTRNKGKKGVEQSMMTTSIPLVVCGGFLQPNPEIHSMYPEEEVPQEIFMISPDPSCVGSIHDRACQMFYQLVGTVLIYTEIYLYITHICILKYICSYIYSYIYSYMYSYILLIQTHTYAHTYTHTCSYMLIHTYTHF